MNLPLLELINAGIVILGLPAIVIALISVGRKFQILDDLRESSKELGKEVKDVIKRLGRLEGQFAGVEASGSPINPTRKGWEWIKSSGLEEILKGKKEELKQKIRDSLPEDFSEYDVQDIALDVVLELEDDPIMRPVKDYAFENGLELTQILRLGRLVLRDYFLDREHETSTKSKSG